MVENRVQINFPLLHLWLSPLLLLSPKEVENLYQWREIMASPGRSSGSPSTICDFARSYRHRPCEGLTESISSLTDDIFQHLKRCQASTRHQTRIPEGLLLLFRSGIFVVSKDVLLLNVCRSHRNSLCTHWYKDSRCCMHPLHPPNHREKPDRGLTCTMAKEIWLHERVVVPVGAGKSYGKVNKVSYLLF